MSAPSSTKKGNKATKNSMVPMVDAVLARLKKAASIARRTSQGGEGSRHVQAGLLRYVQIGTYPFYQRSTPPFSGRRGVSACLLRLRLFLHSHDTKKQNAVLAMKKRKK